MPYLLPRLLVALVLWTGLGWTHGFAASQGSSETILLNDDRSAWALQVQTEQWLEPSRIATPAQARTATFVRSDSSQIVQLHAGNTLWVRLRLVRAAGSSGKWALNLPQPYLDHVALFELQDGAWVAQSAGDTRAQRDWSVRGLYPEFELHLPPGQPTEVLLQIRNFKPMALPLRLAPAGVRDSHRMAEGIALGLLIGLILTLTVVSFIRYAEFRNASDLGAALYSVLIALALAQFNGVLNLLLWPAMPAWADYANSILPTLAAGIALLYGRHLYNLTGHHPHVDRLLGFSGYATLASIVLYGLLDRGLADTISGAVILAGSACGLLATALNWRAGSPLGAWLLWTYTPQFVIVLWMAAEACADAPAIWHLRYWLTLVVAASVPALVYALGRATQDRNTVATRAEHLPTQDALTGLLTAEVFQTQLGEAYERAITHREPLALVLVNVANLDRIRHSMGDPIAEQCLLRAVIKLHRILRDVDPAARVGSARFALLMEGAGSRQALTERLVKLVASGLIPLQGLQPEVTLQFQAACVLLHENPVPPDQVFPALEEVLGGISPRTRRPIRFLEPVPTQLASLHSSLSP
jgi:diguanylate cyclase (GGDEF)-like protein